MDDIKTFRRCKDLLITTHSFKSRRLFYPTIYKKKKIIPTSMSSVLRPSQHIFLDYIRLVDQVDRVFANDSEDLGSIPGGVIPKTLKMVLDTSLFNTQQCKVCIEDKVEQSRERCSALPYISVLWLLKREPSGRPLLRSPTLLYTLKLLFVI